MILSDADPACIPFIARRVRLIFGQQQYLQAPIMKQLPNWETPHLEQHEGCRCRRPPLIITTTLPLQHYLPTCRCTVLRLHTVSLP